jgi:hypothetical protein
MIHKEVFNAWLTLSRAWTEGGKKPWKEIIEAKKKKKILGKFILGKEEKRFNTMEC